jgi:hypothetical protein
MAEDVPADARSTIASPIVIAENPKGRLWISFYAGPENVSNQLEAWFATGEDYRAFDAEGRPLELVVEERVTQRRFLGLTRTQSGEVVVVQPRGEAPQPEDLKPLLVRFLVQEGQAEDADSPAPPLDELIERCVRYSGLSG